MKQRNVVSIYLEKRSNTQQNDFRASAQLAAGLLREDRWILIPLLVLISLPQVVDLWAVHLDPFFSFYLSLLERGLYLVFLLLVSRRALGRLRVGGVGLTNRLGVALRLFVYGIVFWAMVMIPLVALVAPLAAEVKLAFALLLIPGAILALRYYFYFFPIVCGRRTLREVLIEGRALGVPFPKAALSCMAAPLGVMSLLVSLSLMPSPDGKVAAWFVVADILRGTFWVLSVYLSLAYCLLHLSDSRWQELRLDPYRQARLTTLSVKGPAWLAASLHYRRGLFLLLISAFVWGGNAVKIASTPPGPSISLQRVILGQNSVRVELSVEDPRYNYRGFMPRHFALAGNNREVVSAAPSSVLVDGSAPDLRFGFPYAGGRHLLALEFHTERDAQGLRALEDLNLWYRHYKVMLLPMQQATGP